MLKILIVEDELLVARMYQKMAKNEGFDVDISVNGSDSIAKIKEWKPDVVLMDIMMPKMNGFQALEELKADPETKDIPVIILTNISGEHDAELALAKGAKDFWVKKDLNQRSFKSKLLAVLKEK